MKPFVIPINKDKFRKTNAPWNRLMLNDPWSVGYVSQLIELKSFASKEEWKDFYYDMGTYRLKKLAYLDEKYQDILKNEQLIRTNKSRIYQLPKSLLELNKFNGRTEAELRKKGKILFDDVKSFLPNITIEECFKSVEYRVIGETWNGIILREKRTIDTLQKAYPKIEFIKTDGEFDFSYAVDFELYNNKNLVCGIQIKPISYTYNTPYINRAKKANLEKNNLYKQTFGAPVFDVISSIKGDLLDKAFLKKIAKLI